MLPFVKRLVRVAPEPPAQVVEPAAEVRSFDSPEEPRQIAPNGPNEIELSETDLEHVVGGLERVYVLDPELVLRSETRGAPHPDQS